MIPLPVDRLVDLSIRALTLELQLASEDGQLDSATPELRFTQFFDRFRDPAQSRAFLTLYPSLTRSIAIELRQWMREVEQTLHCLCADEHALSLELGVTGPLCNSAPSLGDAHDGGQSVMTLTTLGGMRVVYKPRSLAVDHAISRFIGMVREPRLRVPKVVLRPNYGWAEYISHSPPVDEAAASEFFRGAGRLLGLCTVLGSVDMHFENVVATGGRPVCVDLETALQPECRQGDTSPRSLRDSLLETGLLPASSSKGRPYGDPSMIDISALGGDIPQHDPFAAPVIEHYGQDTMHVVRRPTLVANGQNLPRRTDGTAYRSAEFLPEIELGFRMQLVELADLEHGPVAIRELFSPCAVRVLLRATAVYGRLLTESRHPDLLEDGLERSSFWRALETTPFGLAGADDHKNVIVEHEISALENNDVPIFRANADDRHLRAGDGSLLVADFFDISAVDAAEHRLRALNAEPVDLMITSIRDAFRTPDIETDHPYHTRPPGAR